MPRRSHPDAVRFVPGRYKKDSWRAALHVDRPRRPQAPSSSRKPFDCTQRRGAQREPVGWIFFLARSDLIRNRVTDGLCYTEDCFEELLSYLFVMVICHWSSFPT